MTKSAHIPDDLTLLPRSAAEARAEGSMYYFTGQPCSHGHLSARRAQNSTCQQCANEQFSAKQRAKSEAERPAREARRAERQRLREKRDLDPAYQAEKRERSRKNARESRRNRIREIGTEEYHEEIAARARERYWRNPEAQRQRARERRLRGEAGWKVHRLRTPPWLSDEAIEDIQHMYDSRPEGYHVDHIAPIKHPDIAGLHVPQNLQYIRQRINQRKLNKLDENPEWYVEEGMAVWAEDVDANGEVAWEKYWPEDDDESD